MVKSGTSGKNHLMGGIHIHTLASDGSGDINYISKAAKSAGLDFVVITDHNKMDVKEGFYNGVCVICAEEISPEAENHYLAFGLNKCVKSENPSVFIEEVRNSGGFGFVAHPDEGDSLFSKSLGRKNKHKPIRWTDKNIIPDGIEIWNWFSQWADNLNDKNIFTLAYAYLFRHRLVTEPYNSTKKWWDELNNKTDKIVPAIGGTDVHALKILKYIIPVTVFPYKDMFKTIVNVISINEPLAEDFNTRKNQILNAIKNGNNLIVNRAVETNIPEITVSNSQKTVTAGESICLDKNTVLNVYTNKKCKITVLHNGNEIKNVVAKSLSLLIEKIGKYRVEIKIGKRGFAYSNPIIVH